MASNWAYACDCQPFLPAESALDWLHMFVNVVVGHGFRRRKCRAKNVGLDHLRKGAVVRWDEVIPRVYWTVEPCFLLNKRMRLSPSAAKASRSLLPTFQPPTNYTH